MAEVYKRLIKNCIICWNYLYLSQKLAEIDDPAKWEELLQAMALGSAAAWGHLNLLGEYDFSEDKLQDSGRNQAPKTDRLNQVPSWEFRNRRKSFTPRQLARILWDFAYLCWANTNCSSIESHRTLQGGTGFAPVPGNKLPGYHHLVPPGQRSRENEAPR